MSDSTYSTGVKSVNNDDYEYRHLSNRKNQESQNEKILEEIISKTESLSISSHDNHASISRVFTMYINPLVLTALSAFVRLYRIDASNKVLWDEAHFGKFGSYYLKHEFYFDVHPPLGKLLVGLSGYLSGYDGNFSFDSGIEYGDNCNYVMMRCFNCMFSILCTPIAYKTSESLGFSQLTTWFICLSVIFEMISLTLSKFILLDSMLLFFTMLAFYCLVNVHNARVKNRLLSRQGTKALILTGFSIGCVCSVKWVGLFVTSVIGLYIIYDLLIKFYQLISTDQLGLKEYIFHWISRILTLIIYPFVIYLLCFKIHFLVLNHSGPGDGSISTLLQASLEGNKIKQGPRSVAFDSLVTLRSQGLSPNLLHSHDHSYPEGSQLQQITTYGFKDDNNDFVIKADKFLERSSGVVETSDTLLKHGDTIRLMHNKTRCFLHSQPISAPISDNHYEVSCISELEVNDFRNSWTVEVQGQEKSESPFFQSESEDEVHPISTNFRLKHKQLGCYLATTGYSYPSWGFQQGEVVCKYAILSRDKTTWWNIEDHSNNKFETPSESYVPPKPKFWKEFVLLNYGMLASNNALIPDPDKFDRLSSEWWEWPLLLSGIRLGSWGADDVKYFLMGNPFITWFSTFSLLIFILYVAACAVKHQRQILSYSVLGENWNELLIQGIFPFLAWFLHYFPFVVMGRVKYLHHYVPALYFAILVSAFVMETFIRKRLNRVIVCTIYLIAYIMIIASFWYLKDFSLGMEGPPSKFKKLKVLSSWML
ncbi:hypothetical protein G9P44_001551 [Scheffersomyces stipitis]|nr:hypothetical protein G9P44_001551 [Scheffersomyces stipitis]